MIIITGACGFIGSHLVRALNARGEKDLMLVDTKVTSEKMDRIADCQFTDYCDAYDLLDIVDRLPLRGVFHLGAISDTMAQDGREVIRNNYWYSRTLLEKVRKSHWVPLVYASSAAVYGSGWANDDRIPNVEHPLNVYAWSKLLFDRYVCRTQIPHVTGLRYFNVYGRGEGPKGRSASMVHQFVDQLQWHGEAKVFHGTEHCRRDFVHVDDAVDVTLWAMEWTTAPEPRVLNVGTGRSETVMTAVRIVAAALGVEPNVKWAPFPEQLQGRYQTFTEACIDRLRAEGYAREFATLEAGVQSTWGTSAPAVAVKPPGA